MLDKLSQALFLPTILFALAFLTTPYQTKLPVEIQEVLSTAPYWLFALVISLAAVLNRGRIVITGILIATALLLPMTPWPESVNEWLLTVVIPLNLMLVLFLAERGFLSTQGMLRLIFLLLQAILIYLWIYFNPGLASIEAADILPLNFPWLEMASIHFGDLVCGAILSVSVVYLVFRPAPINQGIAAAFVGYFLIFILPLSAELNLSFLLVSSLLLANGLFRDYYNMAYQDELTGLPQRRALNEKMHSLGRHYTLAMIDIDHFKKFNDTHGHDVGDQVLQMVAAKINQVKGGGRAFRYGGEEFTILFAGKNAEHSAYYLEIIRNAIDEYKMVIRENERAQTNDQSLKQQREKGSFHKASKKVSVTVSIGVAEKVSHQEMPEDVLKRADTALYAAKKAGRNQLKQDKNNPE